MNDATRPLFIPLILGTVRQSEQPANFVVAEMRKLFDENGKLLDENYVRRVDQFLVELLWMARVLRYGRRVVARI